ncbi:response regulator [Candidatus Dojkabacteria bacterium]|uniref:Response regulator n=1 Tax=Candidatus Dojkabacteria bacterium TaxID=2099670 RepID=A0A955L1W4_9BACT|nr:response regulator [Candidatus Dojkabacteria bacterium]
MENKSKILIIEDERMISSAIEEKLSEDSHLAVYTARNGEEGLQKIKDIKPSLVLLDLIMPFMNGVELLKQMREMDEGKDIGVIIISNLDKESVKQTDFKDFHILEYIIKAELDIDDLLKKVQKYTED